MASARYHRHRAAVASLRTEVAQARRKVGTLEAVALAKAELAVARARHKADILEAAALAKAELAAERARAAVAKIGIAEAHRLLADAQRLLVEGAAARRQAAKALYLSRKPSGDDQ